MTHLSIFLKSKWFTYILVFAFLFILVFTSILIYQEKIELVDTIKAAGAEAAILIPIIWNIVNTYRNRKGKKNV